MEGDIVMDPEIKRTIILDNYQNPRNMGIGDDGYIKVNSNNDSCIDNIDIYVKFDGDIIDDIKFHGEACVIAISSTSILSNMLIGKSRNEALEILKNYHSMIEEGEYNKELLGEALVYSDTYKNPSRKTCATLFSREMAKLIDKK